jgi:hypothetical protein
MSLKFFYNEVKRPTININVFPPEQKKITVNFIKILPKFIVKTVRLLNFSIYTI